MFALFFSLVMSWILFPIGLFKSGLSFKGYAIDQDASTFRRIVNLSIGIFTGYLALSYLSDIQGYGKSAYHRFSDLDMSKLTLTDPFEEYIGFFPWLGHQIMAADRGEAGLFLGIDDLEGEAGFLMHAADEVRTVLGLPAGLGRDAADPADAVILDLAANRLEGVEGALDGGIRQAAGLVEALAQTGYLRM